MSYVKVGRENTTDIEIYYEDHGSGRPVVLIHGFPLDGRSWEKEARALLATGYRVITYDRRGFGRSSQPTTGYDYDTFAHDLHLLMEVLDLSDAVLIGHSMGTGEICRYLGRYGSGRVRKAVLVSPIGPYLLRTDDDPYGADQSLFDGFKEAIVADRPAYIKTFFDTFFNVDETMGDRISEQAWQAHFNVGITASATGTYESVDTWHTDFRHDLRNIDVPVLVIQGTADRITPLEATGARLPAMLKDARLVELPGAPHGIPWTHSDEINRQVLTFVAT